MGRIAYNIKTNHDRTVYQLTVNSTDYYCINREGLFAPKQVDLSGLKRLTKPVTFLSMSEFYGRLEAMEQPSIPVELNDIESTDVYNYLMAVISIIEKPGINYRNAPRARAESIITKRRIEKGLTQAQLAEIVGVHSAHITRWENGTLRPNAVSLIRLADALDIDVHDLVRK